MSKWLSVKDFFSFRLFGNAINVNSANGHPYSGDKNDGMHYDCLS